MRYGVGYKGSKSKIAKEIIDNLPSGKRFIDLFGGGGAVSHCAALSGKYESVIYNDVNYSIYTLVKNVFSGVYSNDNSIFEWVSRDRFNKEKDSNPVIKWCWSFGNDGLYYLYSKEYESLKETVYKAIVEYKYTEVFLDLTKGLIPFSTTLLEDRKKEWYSFYKSIRNNEKCRVESLERLLAMQKIKPLENVVYWNISYLDYVYQEGDIVYCDPPYCNKRQDAYKGFDSDLFLNWARKIPCYISEYNMPDSFKEIWCKDVQNNANRINNSTLRSVERLFKSTSVCLKRNAYV